MLGMTIGGIQINDSHVAFLNCLLEQWIGLHLFVKSHISSVQMTCSIGQLHQDNGSSWTMVGIVKCHFCFIIVLDWKWHASKCLHSRVRQSSQKTLDEYSSRVPPSRAYNESRRGPCISNPWVSHCNDRRDSVSR